MSVERNSLSLRPASQTSNEEYSTTFYIPHLPRGRETTHTARGRGSPVAAPNVSAISASHTTHPRKDKTPGGIEKQAGGIEKQAGDFTGTGGRVGAQEDNAALRDHDTLRERGYCLRLNSL